MPLQRELLGDTRPALWALFGAVLVLLAVASANVGGLLLVRSAARSYDLAVRLALGATRHVVRVALAESMVLLGVSSVLGVTLAFGRFALCAARLWTTLSGFESLPPSQSLPDTPTSFTGTSCVVRFLLLRTFTGRTSGRLSSQPPRFESLGKNQASSNPRLVFTAGRCLTGSVPVASVLRSN